MGLTRLYVEYSYLNDFRKLNKLTKNNKVLQKKELIRYVNVETTIAPKRWIQTNMFTYIFSSITLSRKY